MIELELGEREFASLKQTLEALAPVRLSPILRSAAKRAMTAGRLAGSKAIRQEYTIKAGIVRSHTDVLLQDMGAVLKATGPFEPAKSYKAQKRGKGISIAVKKGADVLVPRSFQMPSGAMVQRKGRERFPLKTIGGPSVPQLYGNPDVEQAVSDRALEVYENRLMHELERLVGA